MMSFRTGVFGSLMVWIAASGLALGALAYVPNPWTVVELFETPAELRVPQLPKLKLKESPPLTSFDVIAQRPLFNPNRKPDPEPVQASDATGTLPTAGPALGDVSHYRLVGIAGSAERQIALVRKEGGAMLTLKPGDVLDGWTVTKIGADGVSISGGGRKEVLTIPKAVNRGQTP